MIFYIALIYIPAFGLIALIFTLSGKAKPRPAMATCWFLLPPLVLEASSLLIDRSPGCGNLIIDPLALAVGSLCCYYLAARPGRFEGRWHIALVAALLVASVMPILLPITESL